MACFSNFLEVADDNRVTYTDADWQVRWHCMRGYEPYFTLHKRRRFFGFAWWSGLQKCGDEQPLMEYIKRWNSWPNVRAKPDPTDGRLAGAADDALRSGDGQVHGCWGSA